MITVRCFFVFCTHEVQDLPQVAHDLMEQHYSAVHTEDIRRLFAVVSP